MAETLNTAKNYVLKNPAGEEIRITAEQAGSYNRGANTLAPGFSVTYSPLDATSIINKNQQSDVADSPSPDDPPTKNKGNLAGSYYDAMDTFRDIMDFGKSPSAPSFKDLYNDMREDYGMEGLERNLNDLSAEEESIYAQLVERRNTERDKPVAMNVIEGRVNEAERQEMDRIDYIRRQKQTLVNQISTANATIENMMNLTKMDYDTARQNYNDQFSQQIQMFNTVKGIVDSEKADEERVADNARANLNIIYGTIKDGGVMTPQLATTVTQLELQAGLPSGFYNQIQETNPGGSIISTTTRTANGTKYADILIKQKDGSITSKTITLGATTEDSDSSTDANNDGIPDQAVSWETYLKTAQDELQMSIDPSSTLYAELKTAYQRDFGNTPSKVTKWTDAEKKKLEQAGLLYADRQKQLDFLYGEEAETDPTKALFEQYTQGI